MKTTVKSPITLFEFLLDIYPDSPRTRVKKILQSGTLTVNGRFVTSHSHKLKPGDVIEITKASVKSKESESPFPVLHEDREIIAIDKPAGIATSSIDGSRNIRDELSSFLRDNSKGVQRAWVVHRLDKEVSGVLLLAKSEEIAERIKDHWEQSRKHYYALVEGKPANSEGTVNSYLKEDGKQKVYSSGDKQNGKLAITDYKVLKSLDKYTLLDIQTHTGRKNQIRVHMSDLGCPIVGDRKYGASAEYERRVRLHAYELSFPHPVTGKIITVRSELPKTFLAVKDRDEKYK